MLAILFWFVACGEGDALRSSDAAQTLGDAPQARILEILDGSDRLDRVEMLIPALRARQFATTQRRTRVTALKTEKPRKTPSRIAPNLP